MFTSFFKTYFAFVTKGNFYIKEQISAKLLVKLKF